MNIGETVRAIRERFEKRGISDEILESCYQEYNRIDDVPLFVKRAKKMFPKMNCGLTSAYMKQALGFGEVVVGQYKKHRHTFLIVGSDMIVDITADQYGGPPVYIGPLQAPWSKINS